MAKLSSTPADAVLVAIDRAKNRQEVLIQRPEGGRRWCMTVLATKVEAMIAAIYRRWSEKLATIGQGLLHKDIWVTIWLAETADDGDGTTVRSCRRPLSDFYSRAGVKPFSAGPRNQHH